jgi:hypothetical protein
VEGYGFEMLDWLRGVGCLEIIERVLGLLSGIDPLLPVTRDASERSTLKVSARRRCPLQ